MADDELKAEDIQIGKVELAVTPSEPAIDQGKIFVEGDTKDIVLSPGAGGNVMISAVGSGDIDLGPQAAGVIASSYDFMDTAPCFGIGPALKCIACGGFRFDISRQDEEDGVYFPIENQWGGTDYRRLKLREITLKNPNGYDETKWEVEVDQGSTGSPPEWIHHPLFGKIQKNSRWFYNCATENCNGFLSVDVSWDKISINANDGTNDKKGKAPEHFGITYADNQGTTVQDSKDKAMLQRQAQAALERAKAKKQEEHLVIEKIIQETMKGEVGKFASKAAEEATKRHLQGVFEMIVARTVEAVKKELTNKDPDKPGKSILT